MKLPLHIASRYFASKKSGLVNVISLVSLLSLAVGTASMVVILSVMNGMNNYITDKFSGFDPDFKVEPITGKHYFPDKIGLISEIDGVVRVAKVIEDQALFQCGEDSKIIQLKGVDTQFIESANISSFLVGGLCDLEEKEYVPVTIGYGLFAQMGTPLQKAEKPCHIYTVNVGKLTGGMWQQALESSVVYPTGVFSVLPEYDNRYILAPLSFVQRTLNAEGKVSALEIECDSKIGKFEKKRIKTEIERVVGEKFAVKDKIEQQQALYHSMKAEKWMMIAVFVFVLLVSTFTMVSSLMLLMHEKRKDIAILSAQGMRERGLRSIFLAQGLMITLAGTLIGALLGAAVVFSQAHFGLVKFGMGGEGEYVLETYPVAWQWLDMAGVCFVGLSVGLLACLVPLRYVNVYKRFNS